MEANKRLYRSNRNKMICGVCGGVAEYFNIDPTIVRLVFAILAFSWKGLLIYFLAAIIIPMEPTTMLAGSASIRSAILIASRTLSPASSK